MQSANSANRNMESLVVDTNVLVAAFLESDTHHLHSKTYVDGFERGDYVFHLPMLVLVEVASVIWRLTQKQGMATVVRARKSLSDWEAANMVILYPLNRGRMVAAIDAALRHRLSGADSVVVALAEELRTPQKTLDNQILVRFPQASP